MSYYAVFDTNVLVSSLLTKNPDSATAQVVDAITYRKLIPLYNEEILAEYAEVLCRPKFSFPNVLVHKLLELIQQFGVSVSPQSTGEILPDMDDLVFYEVVMEKRRDDDAYLITGNLKHYPIKPFIVTPAEMMDILNAAGKK